MTDFIEPPQPVHQVLSAFRVSLATHGRFIVERRALIDFERRLVSRWEGD
ncbi:MAG TPA: hypothetical protein VIW64_00260 [Pyrinomonadaceae bacterium]